MNVRSWHFVVGAACLMLAACHPATKPLMSQPGTLSRADTLYFEGVDFSHATFYDPYLQFEDLRNGKIPSWNQRALEDISQDFHLRVENDFETSTARNRTVPESALKTQQTSGTKTILTDTVARQEIAPYVHPRADGYGLLLVVEQINKPDGVIAHYVVFDRRTGAIVLLNQTVGEAGGFGVHNYYLNGLKDVAEKAKDDINDLVR